MTETLPFDFPGYLVQGLVGRGGMGRVYQAEQLATHRPVAIKLLTGGSVDAKRLASFRREAATLAGLEHPHIVPLYDYGEHQGIPYLVVRFLSGGTIADRLTSGRIETGQAVRWITDVADALDTAHRRGVTHRDVKPSNMLLDEAGNVYLGDFGIAATAVDLADAPHSGSAAYASPEQARGEAPDARSDVYSLAVTAFEMLAGQKPYQAETALGMMVRHMHDPVPSAKSLAPGLSSAMDAALAAGMAKKAEDRPRSAGAFAQGLAAAASSVEIPETMVAPIAKAASRPSRGLIIGVGLLLAVACLAGLGALGGGVGALLASTDQGTPTSRPTSFPTLTSPTAEVPTASVPFADDFSDPTSGFAVTPPDELDGQARYADGTLQISVWTPGVELFSWYEGLEEQDLEIEAVAFLIGGPAGSELGIACRWQDENNHIAAAVRGDGMVSLWKRTGGVIERWLDWTAAPQLAGDAASERVLRLTCAGNDVRFAVDGAEVAAAVDTSPASGSVAFVAGLLQAEAQSTIAAFDDLRVTRP